MRDALSFDSIEARVIRLCARHALRHDDRTALDDLVREVRDWDAVVRFAEMHGLAALLLRNLGDVTVPKVALEQLRHGARASVVGSLLMEREIASLGALLGGEGIEWMVVKGLPLSVDAYGELGMRPAGDVDLLVRESDAAAALSLLRRNGYESMIALRDGDWADVPTVVGEWALVRGAANVDLHWALSSWSGAFPLTVEEALASRREVRCGSVAVPTLALDHLVVYLAFHGSKHDWERLEWLASFFAVASRSDVDWDTVAGLAQRLRARRRVALGLRLVERVFGERVGGDRFDDVADAGAIASELAGGLFGERTSSGGGWARARRQMRLMDGRLDALRAPLEGIFAPRVTDWAAMPLPRGLRWLYPVLRPFRLVLKALRRGATG